MLADISGCLCGSSRPFRYVSFDYQGIFCVVIGVRWVYPIPGTMSVQSYFPIPEAYEGKVFTTCQHCRTKQRSFVGAYFTRWSASNVSRYSILLSPCYKKDFPRLVVPFFTCIPFMITFLTPISRNKVKSKNTVLRISTWVSQC